MSQQPGLFGGKPQPLRFIPLHPDAPKNAHPASERAHNVRILRVLHRTAPEFYESVADEYLQNNTLDCLAGVDFAPPDPSIACHRNKSHVARSINLSINLEIAKVLFYGHIAGTFEMESRTPAAAHMANPQLHLQHDGTEITVLPDWVAKCQWDSPEKGRITSALVLDYRGRGHLPVVDFLEEFERSDQRLIELAVSLERDAHELNEYTLEGRSNEAPSYQAFRELNRGLDSDGAPAMRHVPGLKRPVAFPRNVAMVLREATTHALREGASFVGLTDYDNLILLHFQVDKDKGEATRFREGPGPVVSAFILKNEPHKIRRNILGAWLRSIRGE
ncbi:hypothetical protein CSOJ01_10990 [Colletotrichum sojae]|uniref:Uncharacterized protein n=1 Tax=Colletotrichum sojae TaxID=2175907 RepID=A0A8H6IYM9_9PEZI|nr:hypothetical protein CSOJ01_10990 [Colletotrichum sojae]